MDEEAAKQDPAFAARVDGMVVIAINQIPYNLDIKVAAQRD